MELVEDDLHITPGGHLHRVGDRLGRLGKERFHLLGGPEIKLLGLVSHPLGVVAGGLGADADQDVMGLGMGPLQVMHVVGRHAFKPKLAPPRNELPVHLGLLGNPVVLEFQKEILRPERLLVPVDHLPGLLEVVLDDQLGNLPPKTRREGDDPLRVFGQQLLVDARLVIIPRQMPLGRELHQVLVADLVLGQQHQVMIHVPAAVAAFLLKPASRRHIHLAADHRFDPLLPRRPVEIDRPVEHPVIRDRHRRELQGMGLLHQPVEAAGPVQQ